MLKHPFKVGLSFGLTSGIVTTLGLMVGLYSGTHSKLAVIGGILTIAIADAFSDALGIHISEESEGVHTQKEIWQSTFATLFSKFVFAITFVIPVLVFDLRAAIIVGVAWGIFVISAASFFVAKMGKTKPWKSISEHIFIALVVVTATYFTGKLVSALFG